MKKLGILTSVLLLATGISYASDDKTSIRGCLMQMGEDFILTDANGTKYEIDEMNAQLKDHLGHVVEIEGEMEGRSDDDKHEARKLDAKKIKMVSADCSSFNVASAGAPGATTTTTTTTTTGTTAAAGTVESDRDDDLSGAERANASGSASQPEGSGMVTSGTTGPTTHVAGRVDPNTGATSTGTAGGTSVSPDATVAQSAPPDQKPFGQEQRTGEPATGTPEVTEGEARVDTDAGVQAGDRASAGKKREVTGCISRSGDHFILTEDSTGATYRLDGENAKLTEHNGHKVTLVGEGEQLGETSSSGAQFEFDVEEVRHIAPSCAAAGTSTTGHADHQSTMSSAGAAGTSATTTAPAAGASTTTTTTTTAPAADTAATGAVRVESDQPMGKKRDVRGCVSQAGDQFVLTEEGTGATYRLDGEHDKLRQHVNHTVALKGEAEQLNETSGSGAKFEFDVEEVTMISATCTQSTTTPQGIERN